MLSIPRIFLLLLLLALIGGGALYYWRSTPDYAVRDIEAAARDKNLAAFYTRVDLDRILASAIDAANARQNLQGGTWDGLSQALESSLSKVLNAQARTQIKSDIEQRFLTQKPRVSFSREIDQALGAIAPARNLLVRCSRFERGNLAVTGDKALLNISAHVDLLQTAYPLVLILQRELSWKIVGFEGLATALDSFDRDVGDFLKTHNQKQREAMDAALGFSPGAVMKDDFLGFNRQLKISLNLKNRTPTLMRSILGRILLRDEKDATIAAYPIHIKGADLKPDEVRTFSISPEVSFLDEKTKPIFQAPIIRMSFHPEAIEMEAAADLRLIQSLHELELQNAAP